MKRMRMCTAVMLFLACVMPLGAAEKTLSIIHTNDLHSHLAGFSPEIDYTPASTGDDTTIGGWARLAALIKQEKSKRTNPVLVLDAGDFLMGSLFHMVAREEALELRLMKDMGYDLVTLGNHEFDLMPDGLARILGAAAARKGLPEVVFASAVFSKESPKDDSLEKAFTKGLVKPSAVRVIDGIRIGFFGVIGKDAAEVSPFASPVTFRDPVETGREMVKHLREKEKADMVICISHCGLSMFGPGEKPVSEDEVLAKEVPGIDIIISGHTHTLLEKPIIAGNTIIVQAWEYGKRAGVLDLTWDGKTAKVKNYRCAVIDDSIRGDAAIQAKINDYTGIIDRAVLAGAGLSYWKTVASTDTDLVLYEDESAIGNLIADSLRWYVNRHVYNPDDPLSKVDVAVESNGLIRDNIIKGRTGKISAADLFRSFPLGIGMDDTMAYPIITIYVYADEIKKALEVLTSIYPLKGNDYFLQLSGVKFTYNPRRVIFDRVTNIWLGSEEEGYKELDYSSSNRKLYRIAANIYNATFLKIVGNFTFHILDIVPKDRDGKPVTDLRTLRVDADRKRPGIQELKEWRGLMEYVGTFRDTNGDGVPDVPEKYKKKLGRTVSEASLCPVKMLSRGTKVTWIAFAVFVVIACLVVLVVRAVIRRVRKKIS